MPSKEVNDWNANYNSPDPAVQKSAYDALMNRLTRLYKVRKTDEIRIKAVSKPRGTGASR